MHKIDNLILECYKELFKESIPSADFVELMETASLNKQGELEIPFMDYEIDNTLLYEIINKYAKQVKPKWQKESFKRTILLGCSPKSINIETLQTK